MSDVMSAPIPGRLYDIGPTGDPVPARVVALPDGTLCWLWSAHGDPAAAPIDRNDHPHTPGHPHLHMRRDLDHPRTRDRQQMPPLPPALVATVGEEEETMSIEADHLLSPAVTAHQHDIRRVVGWVR